MYLVDTNVLSEARRRSSEARRWLRSVDPATIWSRFSGGRLAAERPRGMADGLTAATALVHQKIVVTRNIGDFADTRTPVINPWNQ